MLRILTRLPVPVVLLLVLAVPHLAAQVASRPIPQLETGKLIRAHADSERVEGTVAVWAPEARHLELMDHIVINAATVDSLWDRSNSAGFGAAIGVIFIGLPAIAFSLPGCSTPGSGNVHPCSSAVLASAAGVGIGAGVGALIGAAFPRWRLIWSRQLSTTRIGLSITH